MKWLKITMLFTIILAVVNAFLGYNIYRQYVIENQIDMTARNDTVALMKNSGINVTQDMIGIRKPSLLLCEFDFFEDYEEYCSRAAMIISGESVSENLTSHMINNGIKIIASESGDVFEFYDGNVFSFMYAAGGNTEWEKYESEEDDIRLGKLYPSDSGSYKKYSSIISEDMFENNIDLYPPDDSFGIAVDEVYRDNKSESVIVYFRQTYSGYPIHKMDAFAVICGEEVVYAKGSLIIGGIGKSYSSVLYDQINILLIEKNYLDFVGKEAEIMNITALDEVYTLFWNQERTKFYMIPSWNIQYDWQISHIRNMVDGDLYIE